MGKFEQEASTKILNRERVEVRTSKSFIDVVLYPVRAFKNWRRERLIRRNIFSNNVIEKLK
jgi:hypothetical protein